MDRSGALAGILPLLALVMMLGGVPHALGRTVTAHHVIGLTLGDIAEWMLSGMAEEADLEAREAAAQQALLSAIFGHASATPLSSTPNMAGASDARRAETASAIPID